MPLIPLAQALTHLTFQQLHALLHPKMLQTLEQLLAQLGLIAPPPLLLPFLPSPLSMLPDSVKPQTLPLSRFGSVPTQANPALPATPPGPVQGSPGAPNTRTLISAAAQLQDQVARVAMAPLSAEALRQLQSALSEASATTQTFARAAQEAAAPQEAWSSLAAQGQVAENLLAAQAPGAPLPSEVLSVLHNWTAHLQQAAASARIPVPPATFSTQEPLPWPGPQPGSFPSSSSPAALSSPPLSLAQPATSPAQPPIPGSTLPAPAAELPSSLVPAAAAYTALFAGLAQPTEDGLPLPTPAQLTQQAIRFAADQGPAWQQELATTQQALVQGGQRVLADIGRLLRPATGAPTTPSLPEQAVANLLQMPEARLGLASALQADASLIQSGSGQALLAFLLSQGNNPAWRDLHEHVADALTRAALAGFSQIDSENPQAVLQAQEQVAELRSQLARLLGVSEEGLAAAFQALEEAMPQPDETTLTRQERLSRLDRALEQIEGFGRQTAAGKLLRDLLRSLLDRIDGSPAQSQAPIIEEATSRGASLETAPSESWWETATEAISPESPLSVRTEAILAKSWMVVVPGLVVAALVPYAGLLPLAVVGAGATAFLGKTLYDFFTRLGRRGRPKAKKTKRGGEAEENAAEESEDRDGSRTPVGDG
ncbi:MAG: hypothetical protein PHO89_06380 [Methylacidiphilaceae bacterium]|nr:hypothetical protein [Candidatus Methylacidiphilaceae bacterium]